MAVYGYCRVSTARQANEGALTTDASDSPLACRSIALAPLIQRQLDLSTKLDTFRHRSFNVSYQSIMRVVADAEAAQ